MFSRFHVSISLNSNIKDVYFPKNPVSTSVKSGTGSYTIPEDGYYTFTAKGDGGQGSSIKCGNYYLAYAGPSETVTNTFLVRKGMSISITGSAQASIIRITQSSS